MSNVERRNGAAEGSRLAWWAKWSRATLGIAILSIVLLWAILPLLESPGIVLSLAVKPITRIDCAGACYSLEVRNGGPWPISINITDLVVYPSLIGPEITVSWLGSEPGKLISLAPFTDHTYVFMINILGGMSPPNRVYVIVSAEVTVLYVSRSVVLHSGSR